jgi:hypothetical protein
MPGVTPFFGLRFKFATDVDAMLQVLDALALDTRRPPMVKWIATANTNLTVNTDTNMNFQSVLYDSHGFANVGVSTTDWTVPAGQAGVYMCAAKIGNVGGTTTFTSLRATILVNGADSGYRNKVGKNNPVGVFGLLVLAVGDTVRLRGRWTGTGGPGTAQGEMAMYRHCKP